MTIIVYNPHHFYQPYTRERAAADRHGVPFIVESPPSAATLASARVVLSHSAPMGRAEFDQLENCRLIISYSTGLDHIDIGAAEARDIAVRSIQGYSTEDVSDHSLAMILSCARRLHQLDRAVRRGEWDVTVTAPGRRRLSRQSVGIVGVGRIGRALGRKAAALGMRVLGYDPLLESTPDDFPGTLVSLDQLLESSDFVSLHTPLTDDTREMIGTRELALMKPTAFVINNGRGAAIDESALLAALNANQIAGAALDVRVVEPSPAVDPLVQHPNVLVTPHAGAFTVDAIEDMYAIIDRLIDEVFDAARSR